MYLFFSRSFRKWSSPLALSGDIVFSMIHIFTFSSVQNVSMIVPHVAFVCYEGSLSLYINTNFSVEKSSGILICGRHELNFCGGRIPLICGSTLLNKTQNVKGVSQVQPGSFPSYEQPRTPGPRSYNVMLLNSLKIISWWIDCVSLTAGNIWRYEVIWFINWIDNIILAAVNSF